MIRNQSSMDLLDDNPPLVFRMVSLADTRRLPKISSVTNRFRYQIAIALIGSFLGGWVPRSQATETWIENVASDLTESFVTVYQYNTENQQVGTGSGFCVGKQGLIATCLHVIGESRRVAITLPDGTQHQPIEIVAWDKDLDLAIIRIERDDLKPLPLAPQGERLTLGETVATMGNPLGENRTLVQGIVAAAERQLNGGSHVQVNIPIELGNSGGPLVDQEGRVHGVFHMKSATMQNLGYAVAVDYLRGMLETQSPISMEHWLKITDLPAHRWKANPAKGWRRKAGRIVYTPNSNTTGLCEWQSELPDVPYVVSVDMRINERSGTGGLLLSMPDQECHRAWIPYNKTMMLLEMDEDQLSDRAVAGRVPWENYELGGWNRLKIEVMEGSFRCYLNGRELYLYEEDHTNKDYSKVGVALIALDHTKAVFKNFSMRPLVEPDRSKTDAKLHLVAIEAARRGESLDMEILDLLTQCPDANVSALLTEHRFHEDTANRLSNFASLVTERSQGHRLREALHCESADISLVPAALLMTSIGDLKMDVASYASQFQIMLEDVQRPLADDATPAEKVLRLRNALYGEMALHIARFLRSDREFSIGDIRSIFEDREGGVLALTLFIVDTAHKIGLADVNATHLSGFISVPPATPEGEPRLLHICDGALETVTKLQAESSCLAGLTEAEVEMRLRPMSKRTLIMTYLHDLKNTVPKLEWPGTVSSYLRTILMLDPDSANARLELALFNLIGNAGTDTNSKAIQAVLKEDPSDLDRERLIEIIRFLGIDIDSMLTDTN